jgi:hypothetical protein
MSSLIAVGHIEVLTLDSGQEAMSCFLSASSILPPVAAAAAVAARSHTRVEELWSAVHLPDLQSQELLKAILRC